MRRLRCWWWRRTGWLTGHVTLFGVCVVCGRVR